jgi:hypothetical protein
VNEAVEVRESRLLHGGDELFGAGHCFEQIILIPLSSMLVLVETAVCALDMRNGICCS